MASSGLSEADMMYEMESYDADYSDEQTNIRAPTVEVESSHSNITNTSSDSSASGNSTIIDNSGSSSESSNNNNDNVIITPGPSELSGTTLANTTSSSSELSSSSLVENVNPIAGSSMPSTSNTTAATIASSRATETDRIAALALRDARRELILACFMAENNYLRHVITTGDTRVNPPARYFNDWDTPNAVIRYQDVEEVMTLREYLHFNEIIRSGGRSAVGYAPLGQ